MLLRVVLLSTHVPASVSFSVLCWFLHLAPRVYLAHPVRVSRVAHYDDSLCAIEILVSVSSLSDDSYCITAHSSIQQHATAHNAAQTRESASENVGSEVSRDTTESMPINRTSVSLFVYM